MNQHTVSQFQIMFLLWSLSVAAYMPTLSGEFLLDDASYITMNKTLAAPLDWVRFLFDASAIHANPVLSLHSYRPLVGFYFGLMFQAFGLIPFWYHLMALFIHGLNTCLVFIFSTRLLGREATVASVCAAILFMLHPAQVESVAYISNAPNLLSHFFVFLTFLAYQSKTRSTLFPSITFAAALLFRESGAALLPMIIIYDLVLLSPALKPREYIKRWAPYAAILAGFFLLRWMVLGQFANRGPWGGDWFHHVGFAIQGLFQNLTTGIWPANLRVCYSFPTTTSFLTVFLKGSALLGFAAATIWALRKRPLIGFSLALIGVTLFPVSNLIPIDALAADRYLYSPLVGFVLLWALMVRSWKIPKAVAATAGLLLFFGLRSLETQFAWQNQYVLDLAAHAAAPEDPCTEANLASHYANWRMFSTAESYLASALRRPAQQNINQSALYMMAFIRIKDGRPREAIPFLQQALLFSPNDAEIKGMLQYCRMFS
ncbi:MAG: hypothetical protein COB53_08810 [Elusimicrobia bacterium]|nr:MAG: hypothetical protein COB53_08810 [Elusimicrobiota bacterium]